MAKARTARSLAYLLAKFPGVRITFVSPPVGVMAPDVKEYLARHNVHFEEKNNLRVVAPYVDAIYLIQTGPVWDSHEPYNNKVAMAWT